jgi:hypothetical protein
MSQTHLHSNGSHLYIQYQVYCTHSEKYVVCPKRNWTFFLKHLLIILQLNKTCLLQSTPLQSIHRFQRVFQFWNAFRGIARRSRKIGDLSEWISTSGTKKSLQGPNLESRAAGWWQSSRASPKIHRRRATCEQMRCHGAASRSCLSTPRPLPSLSSEPRSRRLHPLYYY